MQVKEGEMGKFLRKVGEFTRPFRDGYGSDHTDQWAREHDAQVRTGHEQREADSNAFVQMCHAEAQNDERKYQRKRATKEREDKLIANGYRIEEMPDGTKIVYDRRGNEVERY